jgi:DNA-3-methyladenine glycosylase II
LTNSIIYISLPSDFHYPHILAYLGRATNELLHQREEQSIFKLIEIEEKNWFVKIDLASTKKLGVTVLNGSPDPDEAEQIAQYIREWFDLDRDLTPFYQMGAADALLAPLIERFKGLRIIGVNDLFEALCWSVLGQQVNLRFAYTLKKRLVEQYGESFSREGRKFWLFPQPSVIAKLTKEDLRALSITNRKSEYMIGIAQLIQDGKLSKQLLAECETWQAAEKQLVAIRGIGPWAAHYVLMRCLRFTEAFPIADIGLKNAVKEQLGMERKPTDNELTTLARNWTGWESYATFYLWQSLLDG